VFEKRVLRRIFEPKRDEVTGDWGKLHTEELNILYFLPSIIRVVKSRTKSTEYWNCSNYISKIIHVPCNKLIQVRTTSGLTLSRQWLFLFCRMKEYCLVFGINIVNGNYNYNANTYKIFKDIYILRVLYVKEMFKFNKNFVNVSNVIAFCTLHIV
jgi:hypothetical protein